MRVFFIEKYTAPLIFIFIFLFTEVKAEFKDSAFSSFIQKDVDTLALKKYRLAKRLFESEEYSKALKYALEIVEEKDPYLKIQANILVGNILKRNNSSKTALHHFKEALSLINSLEKNNENVDEKLSVFEAESLLRISSYYLSVSKPDSSKIYLDKILRMESLDDRVKKFKGDAHSNIATMHIAQGKKLDLAEEHINKAIAVHESLLVKEPVSISADYNNLANIYALKLDFNKAKDLYKKALSFLENENSIGAIENKEFLNDNIAWAMYNLKDYKAYNYLYKSNEFKQEINQRRFNIELKKIELKHNIDLIKKEEENKRVRLQRNNWIIAIIGIVISLLFLYFASTYKLKQDNLKLQLSKKELEQQRKLDELKSESQVKIINAAIDGKETERKQIAETLHDNVSALLSSANLHLRATQKQFNGELPIELQKTQSIILEASQQVRDLSHNLVSSILLKFGLEYAVKDAAKKYSNSELKINVLTSNIQRYDQEYEIKLFNIIQELINNILKHSKAKNAYIILEQSSNVLSLIVKDDGIGFDTEKKAEGIGIRQIQARIYVMKGSFEIESDERGTRVNIDIPIDNKRLPLFT